MMALHWRLLFFSAALAFFLLLSEAQGQSMKTVSSTPDIEVTITAVTTVEFRGGPVDWIAIKNDGPGDIYFDLKGGRDKFAEQFPLKLEDGESFSAYLRVHSVVATAAGSNSASAFFTIQAGRW